MREKHSGIRIPEEIKERLRWNDANVTKFMYWVKLFADIGAMDLSIETKSTGEQVYKLRTVTERGATVELPRQVGTRQAG